MSTTLPVPAGDHTMIGRPKELYDHDWDERISMATEIAEKLTEVIEKQQLRVKIGSNMYVTREGWQICSGLCGLKVVEREVFLHTDGPLKGTWEATVEIVDRHGDVQASGSGICSPNEKAKASQEEFQRRSMAITRAVVKAHANGFSWIIKIAGYMPTPHEEMFGIGPKKGNDEDTVDYVQPTDPPKSSPSMYAKAVEAISGCTTMDECRTVQARLEVHNKEGRINFMEFQQLMQLLTSKMDVARGI